MSTRLPSPIDGVAASTDTSLSWQSRRELSGVAQGKEHRKTLELIDLTGGWIDWRSEMGLPKLVN